MHNLQSPDFKPADGDVLKTGWDDDASAYDDIPDAREQESAVTISTPPADKPSSSKIEALNDAQDNYIEAREPAELAFCIILAAAYAGLARFLWEPLELTGQWFQFFSVEGFFITIALLSILLGVRPYLSPSNLQISNHGIKYRGPYWPQRKTVNWNQIFRLYLSTDLIVIFYHLPNNPKARRCLFLQCNYLADRENILASIAKYTPVPPTYLKNPDWYIKGVFLIAYLSIVCWILYMLR